ncbi:hypothetical protein Acsp02_23320 [Actinoplanes sp. NBRC 103695]|nr:hypothetical protein Acsp02_23320 [Actinoplanes sp. NBRC 103695]
MRSRIRADLEATARAARWINVFVMIGIAIGVEHRPAERQDLRNAISRPRDGEEEEQPPSPGKIRHHLP